MLNYKINMQPKAARTVGGLLLICIVQFFLHMPAGAQTDDENWQRWALHNEQSVEVIDHSIWNGILQTYVETDKHGQNLVNYAAVSPADKHALKQYLEMLSLVNVPSLNKNEQLAFWINTYNALITDIILDDYPVESILDIGGGLFSRGPWKDKRIIINEVSISLADIKGKIIPAGRQDVRVIYALSCGAVGCPNIGTKAVGGKYVDGYLDAATFAFINGPNAILAFDDSNIILSKTYYWHKSEFLSPNPSTLDHLKSYAMGSLSRKLENIWHIGGYDFNWYLNEVKDE